MSMGARERVLAAMNREEMDRPPVAVLSQSATVGMMESCGAAWPAAHYDPQLMATLGAAQADIFGFECVRAPFGITAEAERLGVQVTPATPSKQPIVIGNPFKFDAMLSEFADTSVLMSPEEFLSGGRPAVVVEATSMLAKSHGETHAVVAGNTGTLTLAGMLLNTENLVFGMIMAPDEVQKWLNAVYPFVDRYTDALHDAGADIIQCSEPVCSGDWMSKDNFEPLCGRYVWMTHAPDPAHGRYTELHVCGNSTPVLRGMADTGVSAISISDAVSVKEAVSTVGDRVAVIGNVSVVDVLLRGTQESVAAAAGDAVYHKANIIAPGCGLHPETPNENLRAMVDSVVKGTGLKAFLERLEGRPQSSRACL